MSIQMKIKTLFMLMIVFVCVISGCESEGDDSASAKAVAKLFVEDNLKSPSSADFCWESNASQQDDGSWYVSGCVDAENGFGAELRADWEVEIIFDEEIDDWRLLDIYIE
jgi:hypothetical protein